MKGEEGEVFVREGFDLFTLEWVNLEFKTRLGHSYFRVEWELEFDSYKTDNNYQN